MIKSFSLAHSAVQKEEEDIEWQKKPPRVVRHLDTNEENRMFSTNIAVANEIWLLWQMWKLEWSLWKLAWPLWKHCKNHCDHYENWRDHFEQCKNWRDHCENHCDHCENHCDHCENRKLLANIALRGWMQRHMRCDHCVLSSFCRGPATASIFLVYTSI